MNPTKLSTRIVTSLALALGTTACQPRGAAAAADPGSPPEGGAGAAQTTAVPPAPPAEAQRKAAADAQREAQRLAADAQREAVDVRRVAEEAKGEGKVKQREAMERQGITIRADGKAAGGYGGMSRGGSNPFGVMTSPAQLRATLENPAVIGTAPLDDAVREQWQEDLGVMDKILRDATGGGGPEAFVMGIKLTSFGRVSPMYVEGAGAVFSYNVGWPLAPSNKQGEGAADRPRERPSAWENARRELKGQGPIDANRPPAVFEQDKLDAFVDAIVRVLPEASNFRHLKGEEFVFVTVSGLDESGAPARLTLKVRKADVDQAASGAIDAAAFRQRVSRRVG